MTRLSIRPDNFTFPFLLNSCASLSLFFNGAEIHSRAVKSGHCKNIHVSNAFIDMYGKCGSLILARKVFDEMPVRDAVSYNAILGAHARVGEDMGSAKCLFDEMPDRNVITWNAMIVGYVTCGELSKARKIFDEMPSRNILSWSVLIMGYCKCRLLDDARELFDRMPSKNLVSWSLMITGYSQVGRPQEAMSLFYEMDKMGFTPDAAIITGVISAAAKLGEAEFANSIGSYMDRKNIERNERVLTSLIDMHAKCGNVEQALHLFDEITNRDTFAYAALINGLASHGHGMKALEIYDRMREEGLAPDDVVFVGVLRACSHAGLVDKGLEYWESMDRDYGIKRGPDHYACIVDVLSRAGRIEEAFEMSGRMPLGSHTGALGALLAGCKTYGNLKVAEVTAEKLFVLEPANSENYVLLSSIYASKEQWEDAARVRRLMEERCVRKQAGSSWL